MSTALVTGATGFVGSHLVERLVADEWDVHVLTRRGRGPSLGRLAAVAGRLTVHHDPGDVRSLAQAVARVEIDACFHLASYVVARHTPDDIAPLVESNVAFPARLAEALSGRPELVFVNAGTFWQHVGGEPYRPAALYAATKQAGKDILRHYDEAGAFQVVNLALFDTYGPDDPRPKLLNLLRRAQQDGTPLAVSAGEQLIDLVYVDDVVDAFLAAAGAPPHERFPQYAVTSGAPLSLRALVALVEQVTGAPVPVAWGARAYRAHEMWLPWDAGPPVPGWRPRVPLEEGVKRTWTA